MEGIAVATGGGVSECLWKGLNSSGLETFTLSNERGFERVCLKASVECAVAHCSLDRGSGEPRVGVDPHPDYWTPDAIAGKEEVT